MDEIITDIFVIANVNANSQWIWDCGKLWC